MRTMNKHFALLLASALMAGCVTTKTNEELKKAVDNYVPESGYKEVAKGALEATKESTPEDERKMGHEMSAMLLGAQPLVKQKAANLYVNQIGMWIALQSEMPDLPWRFGIIDTPNLNAFAAPGGYIFVTRGLLLRVKDESELAGVLAHEIGHVIKHHHASTMKKRGAGQIVSGLVQIKAGNEGKEGLAAFNNVAKNIYSSGLDKSDEYEADRIGVVLATRAGYSPFGLPAVLQMYAASPGDSTLELLFATHPSPTDRLNELDNSMGSNFDSYADKAGSTKNLTKIQKLLAYHTKKSTKKKS